MATTNPITPEARALGGSLYAKDGDIPRARRLAEGAYAHLCSIDDTYRAPEAPAPANDGDPAKVAALQAELDAAKRAVENAKAQLAHTQAALAEARTGHVAEVAALRAKIARLAGLDDTPPAPIVAPPAVAVPPQAAKVTPNGSDVSPAVAKWQAANARASR
jgi:hypothetical protein